MREAEIITIDGDEPVMTVAEWDDFVRVEQLVAVAEAAQFMRRPGIQNGLAKIEEMEADV